jgi:hypothetical protein
VFSDEGNDFSNPHSSNTWLQSNPSRITNSVNENFEDENTNLTRLLQSKLPSTKGYRKLSIYSPKYGDEQRLIIEETHFKESWNETDLEDHPLLIFIPMMDGTTKEIFRGIYPHQHTDIYLVYFYTEAFYEELKTQEDSLKNELTFQVGWFDQDGNEIDPYSMTPEDEKKYDFGVKFDESILQLEKRETFLEHLALTILTGDKSYWWDIPEDVTIKFLVNGKVIKKYQLNELEGRF